MIRPEFNFFRKTDVQHSINPEIELNVAKAVVVSETSDVTIDAIREKLSNGDLSALDDLDALRCPYELIEKNGGYTVKFSYEGAKYTITYFAPEEPEVPETPETPEEPSDDVGNGEAGKSPDDVDSETPPTGGTPGLPDDSSDGENSDGSSGGGDSGVGSTGGAQGSSGTGGASGASGESGESPDDVDSETPPTGGTPGLPDDSSDGESSDGSSGGGDSGVTPPLIPTEETIVKSSPIMVDAIDEVISERIDAIVGNNSKLHTEFGMDKDGNIVFQEASARKAFGNLLTYVEKAVKSLESYGKINKVLESIGGEDNLKKLIQAAWVMTYNSYDSSQSNDAKGFVKKVLENLQLIFKKLEAEPQAFEYFTTRGAYADTSVTEGVTHYNKNTTYGGDETIIYSEPVEYDDGTIHIENTRDDNDYQTTMKELLERLQKKYPNLDKAVIEKIFREAQKNALKAAVDNKLDCPYGTGNNGGRAEDSSKDWSGNDNRKGDKGKIDMDELVQLTLYNFDKLFLKSMTETKGKTEATKSSNPVTTPEIDSEKVFQTAVEYIDDALTEVIDMKIDNITEGAGRIHTEFGISEGAIVFQDSATKTVYDRILTELKNRISRIEKYGNMQNILEKFGGEACLQKIIQAAWIATYNNFDSSTSNDSQTFVTTVLRNLRRMLEKIKNNPQYVDLLMQQTSYSDKSLTDGLKHYDENTTYGGDETILYSEPVEYDDGTIHIENTRDDNDYQTTMKELLERLKKKYPTINPTFLETMFREAQKNALNAAVDNKLDCPYGTGNNSGRVEDSTKDWSGYNNRKGDKGKIDMDELVQLTLYHFDKLLYKNLMEKYM